MDHRFYNALFMVIFSVLLCACESEDTTTPDNVIPPQSPPAFSDIDEPVDPPDEKTPVDPVIEEPVETPTPNEPVAVEPHYTVGGMISGLSGTISLQLKSSQGENRFESTRNGSFAFVQSLENGDYYEVSIIQAPFQQKCLAEGGFGTVLSSDVNTITITCATRSSTASLSGEIRSSAANVVDADLNDPNADYQDNNDYDTAQSIDNIATIHGFASYDGTWSFEHDDRFSILFDEFDVYRTHLQANQIIELQVVDYNGFDVGSVYEGDLDLYIGNSAGDLVSYSTSVDEFEQIIIEEEGEYFIVVSAYEGISKYVLRLHAPSKDNGKRITSNGSVDFVPNEMIVKFKPNQQLKTVSTSSHRAALTLSNNSNNRATLAKVNRNTIRHQSNSAAESLPYLKNLNPVGYEKIQTLREIKALSQQPNTESVAPNYRLMALSTRPNDEYYPMQWHYPLINLPQAWDITTASQSGDPVIVAVVDSGVFLNHPDMQGQLVPGYDFVSDINMSMDGNGIDNNPDDPGDNDERGKSSYHGTHVAGTIAAKSNDSAGVAGVAWGAKIMPIRVMGRGASGTDYDIMQGVRFAAGLENDSGTLPARRADIINLSLGGPGGTQAAQRVYDEVRQAGVIVVAAAGNSNTSQLSYPASYDGIISVSAVDMNKQITSYSNYGIKIDVAAPGGDRTVDLNGDGYADGVLSTLVDDTSGRREPVWTFYEGTSMASPHVAGVIALMKSVYPELTPEQVDTLLQNGELTSEAHSSGWDQYFGYGLIDALKAVSAAQRLASGESPTSSPEEPVAHFVSSPSTINLGSTNTAIVQIANQGSGTASVSSTEESVSWLNVSAQSINDEGLGSYRITANRGSLQDGYYQAEVNFTFSDQSTLSVPVYMQVGMTTASGELAQQYVLLMDAETGSVVQAISAEQSGNTLSYHFDDVAVGEYYLFSGSDIDNDQIICQSGESCGAYPSITDVSGVTVLGDDLSNLDVVVDILGGGFSASTSTSNQTANPSGGLPKNLQTSDRKYVSK